MECRQEGLEAKAAIYSRIASFRLVEVKIFCRQFRIVIVALCGIGEQLKMSSVCMECRDIRDGPS